MGYIVNFLKETVTAITDTGNKIADIAMVTDGSTWCSWEKFKGAIDFTYDAGYGIANINRELKIVFKDGSWLERGEYDGSEWWEHKAVPTKPSVVGLPTIK